MKPLQHSLKKLHQMRELIGSNITGILIENQVADNATTMQRTRLKGVSAWCRDAKYTDGTDKNALEVPVIAVLSVAAWNGLPAEYGIDEIIEASTMAISLDIAVNSFVETDAGTTVAGVVRDVARVNGVTYTAKEPDDELDALMCGKDFYLVLAGGSFDVNARISIEFDRVNITQDEWLLLNTGSC